MDALGHVNNARFFTYFEQARIAFFDHIDANRFWSDVQGPVLASATCNFRRMIKYPADLEVGTRVLEIRNRSFVLETAVFQVGDDGLLADGTTAVVWADYREGKSVPMPDELRAALEGFGTA
ncbi:acyl-CoA thioesterase [Sulfidibacter corallicola]|uniref:Acyl-CoA thioesterase n=2 Tax=Sulfidibacter corallicola TaxID=2818388 RepID=A0A8A4TM19_SULCO|nr:acyl-CoA thioesterase [Sulfidibacter corallicola]